MTFFSEISQELNRSFLADLMNQFFIETLMLSLHHLVDHLYELMTTCSLLHFSNSFSENSLFQGLPRTWENIS